VTSPDRPSRAPLPEDPWSLPTPGPAWDEALDTGVAAIGVTLTPAVRQALDAHTRLLLAWTEAINLTAVRDPAAAARLHLVDSLSAVPLLRRETVPAPAILDLGSGGGLPGLPLAVALPAGRLALVDSIAKKVRFLDVAGRAAAAAARTDGGRAPSVSAIAARAEELARRPGHRAAWDVVTARAVGVLGELVELGLPLLRVGGLLVSWKRDDGAGSLAAEVADATPIARAVGAGPASVVADPEPALPGHRLVVLRMERATPDRFPRAPAERRRSAGP
jgi:16S rRNA (guanine527-N7)-methyltransferase